MFYERYLELCREAGITPSAAAMEIGFSKTLVSRWKRGGGCTDATLDRVANYFGVSLEWLKGETDEKTKKAAPDSGDGQLTERQQQLFSMIQQMDDAELKLFLDIAQKLTGQQPSVPEQE